MSHTILLADDSVTIHKVVDIVFEKEPDFAVVKVGNGNDAIARARELRPSLVLADHLMPGRSGYEVAEALKADPSTAHIPVLLLSGSSAPFDEARAAAAGCVGHLPKPFDCQSLLDRVMQAVGGSSADPLLNKSASSTAPAPFGAPQAAPQAPRPAPPPAASPLPVAPAAMPPRSTGPLPSPAAPAAAATPGVPAGMGAPASAPPGLQPGARPGSRDPFGFGLDGADAGASSSGDDDIQFAIAEPSRPAAPAAPAPSASQAIAAVVAPAVTQATENALSQTLGTADGAPSRDAISAATREIIERVVWEVVPELAETLIREEIERLLKQKGG